MRIVRVGVYRSPTRSPEKGLVIFEDADGWLYLKALVEDEGFATPFSSIAEVETYIGERLELDFWKDLERKA